MLVDDHTVVLHGLRMFLGLDPELEVIGEANNGAEAVTLAHELRPDVILMDLLMPIMDGITATTIIRRELPEIEVVALTSVLEDDKVIGAIRAGAIGYLLKDTEADELRRAIKAAAAGQVQLSPRVVERLLNEVKGPDSPQSLGDYEQEVLRLLARGRSNDEIAQALDVGEKTVKTLVGGILDKLGVPSRTQAALYAVRTGLISIDEAAVL
jgi:DNA-binding NarL/FixJ family response regulator